MANVYDVQNGFSATQNNGKVANTVDSVTGETANYTYDTLNRLSAASGSGWAENFTYDGFGNLTDKTPTVGSPPALHVTVNASNNQLVAYTYDANGNLRSSGAQSLGYDVANRIVTATTGNNPSEQYAYGPANLRVWKLQPDGTESLYFYGAFGELLGEYPVLPYGSPPYHYYFVGAGATRLYFAGKLINGVNGAVVQDRLGSVAYESGGNNLRYYPWGEEYTTTTQNQEKFGTYYRDKTTALDYARNRYYSNTLGRFLTADPYRAMASGANNPADPGSWNRYAYVGDDPVNFGDQAGLDGNGCSGGCYYWQVPPSHPPQSGQFGDLLPLAPPAQAPTPPNPGPPTTGGGQAGSSAGVPDLADAADIAEGNLRKKKCRDLFGSGADPATVLADAVANKNTIITSISYQDIGTDLDAKTEYAPYENVLGQWIMPSASITINSNSSTLWGGGSLTINQAFFGKYTLNQFRAEILIHELVHVYQQVVGLGGATLPNHPRDDSVAFDKEIFKDCF